MCSAYPGKIAQMDARKRICTLLLVFFNKILDVLHAVCRLYTESLRDSEPLGCMIALDTRTQGR
jgi:hypothetical protein